MNFSVIIPCHNAGPYIGAALDSVARQTLAPRQIIVVDDRSGDDSVSIIENHALNVELIRVSAGNAALSRNIGARSATADWLAFLDADDIWYDNHLERAAKLLEGGNDIGMINSPDGLTLEGEPFSRKPIHPADSPINGVGAKTYMQWQHGLGFPGMTAAFVRKNAFNDMGGLDESQLRRHDIELWLRLIQHGTFAYDPVASSAYRIGVPGSVSRANAESTYFHLRAFTLHREALAGPMMDKSLKLYSRRAMAAAYTDGALHDRKRARELAWPFLSTKDRFIFGFFACCPGVFALMNRRRRKGQTHARDAD